MINDPISDQMQASTNIAWFGVDMCGRIGSFESCGFAWIHPAVLVSESRRQLIHQYFRKLPESCGVLKHRAIVAELGIDSAPDVYCESAAYFAKRGVYVYDVPITPQRETEFVLLVEPESALNIDTLPAEIRDRISATRLAIDFTRSARFRP